jgi:DNA replication and repair protein RecF
MTLLSVEIDDFRCFSHARFELDPETTLISGPNASGKSTLLEAIFLLGRGRSFRTSRLETAIRQGAERLQAVGHLKQDSRSVVIGVEARPRQTIARISGEPASSLAALSVSFPVQVIEPGIHKLIEEGPILRRRFLDWGVFHVEPRYLDLWQRFHRALRQRNAALRTHAADETLDAWDVEFAKAGEELTQARTAYLAAVSPFITAAAQSLLNRPFPLEYRRAWPHPQDLLTALHEHRGRDRQRRTTTVGPHRADLIVKAKEGLAKEFISRGQQKLLSAALILGQLAYHAETFYLKPTLLLDDPAAELDAERLGLLVAQVKRLKAQLVITSLHADFDALGRPGRMFHVEQGRVISG